jgi:Tfp pilus assembly protein PilE
MIKKIVVVLTILAVLVCFSLPSFAAEVMKGKVTTFDKEAKKIQIDEKEYTLSDEASSVEVMVGDEIEATVDGDVVQAISK